MTTLRRALAPAAAALLGLALAGCTGSPEPDPEPTDTPAAEEQTPAVTDVVDAPGSGEGYEGALQDVEIASCELADGASAVSGTVTNPAEGASNYRIYVSLLSADGDTRGLVQTNVDGVAPGDTAEWSAQLETDEEDLDCVPRIERYPAG